MGTDKKIMAVLAVPFAAIIIAVMLTASMNIKPSVSPAEKALLVLSPETTVNVIDKRQSPAVSSLLSPIRITGTARPKGFPPAPLSQVAPQRPAQGNLNVSLVMVNADSRMAIINGIVVREGDMIESERVVQIGRKGVLVQDKTESRWLQMN